MGGYNGTIFCYGQTGSGKSYTMIGKGDKKNPDELGLIPLILDSLFTIIEKSQKEDLQIECVCSFLEIYNEKITDLLDFSKNKPDTLQIREGIRDGVYVESLLEAPVKSADDAFGYLKKGLANRHVGSTQMNEESSRSHSVFTINIKQTQKCPQGIAKIRTSKLNLIDLAGSERQKSTKAEGERLNEACHINKSLLVLGTVINSLVDVANGKERHINYRESKLTFLLKDSLGGNSQTIIVANCTPSIVSARETLSTLKFAQRAKFIKNKPIVNEDSSVQQLKEEIKNLKAELENYKKKTIIHVDTNNFESNNITSQEEMRKYQIIQKTLAQLQESENQVEVCLKKIDLLTSLENSRTEFNNQMKMALKLRECEIAKLKGVRPRLDLREQDEGLNRIEKVLKEFLHPDIHPSALKFAAENLFLKEEISNYETQFGKSFNEEIPKIKELKEYSSHLRQELDSLIERVQKNGYKKELDECLEKLKHLEKSEQSLKHKVKDLESQNAKMMMEGNVMESLSVKNNRLQDIYNECKKDLERKTQDVVDLENIVEKHQGSIINLQNEKQEIIQILKSKEKQIQDMNHHFENEELRKKKEMEIILANFEQLQLENRKNEERLYNQELQMKQFREEMMLLQQNNQQLIQELQNEKEKFQSFDKEAKQYVYNLKESFNKQYLNLKKENEYIKKDRDQFYQEKMKCMDILKEKEVQLTMTTNESVRLSNELNMAKENISVLHQLNYDKKPEMKQIEFEKLKTDYERLKKKIQLSENVNINKFNI